MSPACVQEDGNLHGDRSRSPRRNFIVASARWLAITVFLMAGGTCKESQPPSGSSLALSSVDMPSVVNEASVPAAAVYVQLDGLSPREPSSIEEPQVIVAVWKDGRVVWSQDSIKGGPPYRTAKVDPEQLTTVLNELETAGVFRDPSLNEVRFGPDSSYTVIAVADGNRALHMRSWHELFESNPNLVVTSLGVTSLEGRDRQAVLRSEPKGYRRFRTIWKDIRAKLTTIVPKQGDPAEDVRFEVRSIRLDKVR